MKTSKVYLLVIAVSLGGAVLFSAKLARSAPGMGTPTRVGVCDVVQVLQNYDRAKDLTAKLNEKRETLEAENKTRVKVLEATELELEALLAGSEEYERRFSELQRQVIEHKTWAQFEEGQMRRKHHRLTKEMYEDILKMVSEVAQQNGYHIVLYHINQELQSEDTTQLLQQIERQKVLYADNSVNLTDTVLLRLNETYRMRVPSGD
ncbi:MAG: OmpH/Skp family outer membrane protein [Planctomycetota bacterium]|jgi:Skp family chaperone for outer membrane proteins